MNVQRKGFLRGIQAVDAVAGELPNAAFSAVLEPSSLNFDKWFRPDS